MSTASSDNYTVNMLSEALNPEDRLEHGTENRIQGSKEVTDRLLESAVIIFGERGFNTATVAEIARHCDLTTGAVYARWPTKRDLFMATIEYVWQQRSLRTVASFGETPEEKLSMLGANLLNASRSRGRDLWLEACVSSSRDASLHGLIAQAQGLEADEIAAIIEQGKAASTIDSQLNTDVLVFFCQAIGFGVHLAARVQSAEHPRPSDDDWATFIERLIAAMTPPPPLKDTH